MKARFPPSASAFFPLRSGFASPAVQLRCPLPRGRCLGAGMLRDGWRRRAGTAEHLAKLMKHRTMKILPQKMEDAEQAAKRIRGKKKSISRVQGFRWLSANKNSVPPVRMARAWVIKRWNYSHLFILMISFVYGLTVTSMFSFILTENQTRTSHTGFSGSLII